MGCNCRKSPPPLGMKRTQQTQDDKKKMPVMERSKGRTQSFTLTRVDGTTATFGSRLEAEAARRRAGGGTVR